MASILRQINKDAIKQRQLAAEIAEKEARQRLGENREWVVITYQQNPITLDVLKQAANNGKTEYQIYNADTNQRPYNRIGEMIDYQKSPNTIKNVSPLERSEMIKDACYTVKRLFEKANNDNNWNLKVIHNCNDGCPTIKVKW
jgi:hypothetical protein